MKKLVLFVLCIFCANLLSAQFGINAGYRSNGANNWEKYFPGQDFLKNGMTLGIDYWFRLKNKRIEFTPELAYSHFNGQNELPLEDIIDLKSQFYSLNFNTNIYFLDLQNDCNCPTWSKNDDYLKKGLFLQISPGANYFQNSIENSPIANETSSNFVFSLGAGLGFDLGISNLVTVTPKVAYHYFFNATWEGLSKQLGDNVENELANESTDLNQIYVGIRIGIRLDQQNYGFR